MQLNLKMAIESGVSQKILDSLTRSADDLPPELADVRSHARAVAQGFSPDADVAARIEDGYGKAAFAELALCIAGVGIYPRLKRALMKETECSVVK